MRSSRGYDAEDVCSLRSKMVRRFEDLKIWKERMVLVGRIKFLKVDCFDLIDEVDRF